MTCVAFRHVCGILEEARKSSMSDIMTGGMAKSEKRKTERNTERLGEGLLWTYGWEGGKVGRSRPEVTGPTAARGEPQVPT